MRRTLVIDIGGSKIKVRVTGRKEALKLPSGKGLTPNDMVQSVRRATADWKYDNVSIGYPGAVTQGLVREDTPNLGKGWVRFNFAKAFGRPVRVINDAAMQALGSYRGGYMLFLGLGTGLGSTLVLEDIVHPLELGDLPYGGRSYADYLGKAGRKRLGRTRWLKHVRTAVEQFKTALQPDYIVLGGGGVKHIGKAWRPDVFRGHNSRAFIGGFRSWQKGFSRHLRTAAREKKKLR